MQWTLEGPGKVVYKYRMQWTLEGPGKVVYK